MSPGLPDTCVLSASLAVTPQNGSEVNLHPLPSLPSTASKNLPSITSNQVK